VDDFHAFCPSLFPIKADEKAVDIYESKRNLDLIKLLNISLQGRWIMISLFSVGRFLSNAKPTAVVLVKPWTETD
jgi:hypothetical protein